MKIREFKDGERKARPGEARRFLEGAAKSNTDKCIIWPFYKSLGYGQCTYEKMRITAHRAVLLIKEGEPLPPKTHACHDPEKCSSRACINPKHLRWGTHSENMMDKAVSGTSNRGERQGRAKLNETQVLEIRKDKRSYVKIAKEYKISPSSVGLIKRKVNWAWLS